MFIYNSLLKLGFSNTSLTLCLFVLVILMLGLFLHRTYYIHSDRFMELASKIPGPTWYPFIGSAYVFGTNAKDIMQNVTDLVLKYEIVSKYWIGPMLYVCLQDFKDIEAILSNNKQLNKPIAYELMKMGTGDGILVSSEEKWKKRRKALKPTFSYQVYENYIDAFNSKMKVLVDVLETKVKESHFNIGPIYQNLITDILWETILTTKSNTLMLGEESRFSIAVNTTVEAILCRMFKPWLYVDAVFNSTANGKVANSHLNYLHSTIKKIISGKKKELDLAIDYDDIGPDDEIGNKRETAFLDYTVYHALGNGLSDEDIAHETYTILFAGFDAAAATLAFVTKILSHRFDIQENIVDEIKEVFGTLDEKPFTFQDLQRLQYLERVIKETLRLFSTIPFVARQITDEITLPSGYTLPNGCAVVLPFFRLHRDPKHYPNPHVFDPDNFLPTKVAARSPYTYCPFSAGPRDCIGRKFAVLEVKAAILSVIRRFWIIPTDSNLELAAKMNLHVQNGVHIGLKRRTVERPSVNGLERLMTGMQTNIDYLNIKFKEHYN